MTTRRAIRSALWSLLAGVVLTWAIAWACAYRAQQPGVTTSQVTGSVNLGRNQPSVRYYRVDAVGFAEIRSEPMRGPFLVNLHDPWPVDSAASIPAWARSLDWSPSRQWSATVAAGWPLLALTGDALPDPGPTYGRASAALVTNPAMIIPAQVLLPLRPWLPGLLVNILFWGGITFGLGQTPAWFRRSFRKRRGLCARCGYALFGLPLRSKCPECGNSAQHDTGNRVEAHG